MQGINITAELVVFLFMIIGAIAGAWWRVENAISKAKQEANDKAAAANALATLTQAQFAEYRTHVAETYVSKTGFRETMESLNETLRAVNNTLHHLSERIDRVIDNRGEPKPPR